MRISWIPLTEKVDDRTLQVLYWAPDQKFFKKGGILKFCRGCKRWVTQHDYNCYCKSGMHELAQEVSLDKLRAQSEHVKFLEENGQNL